MRRCLALKDCSFSVHRSTNGVEDDVITKKATKIIKFCTNKEQSLERSIFKVFKINGYTVRQNKCFDEPETCPYRS